MTEPSTEDTIELPELPAGPERDVEGLLTRDAIIERVGTGDDRTIRITASTEDEDGHGTILRNWKLDRFKQNPVVLFAHNRYDLPIGTAEDITQGSGKLDMTVRFLPASANPMAERCYRCAQHKALRAASVGFRRLPETKVTSQFGAGGRETVVIDGPELSEVSMLPLGSNPHALAQVREDILGSWEPEMCERGPVPYSPTKVGAATKWDGGAAERRLLKWAGDDAKKRARGYAWWDGAKNYKLPHHDVVDGELVVVRAAVIAAGNAIQGARGGVKVPAADKPGVRAHLAKHYRQLKMSPPWEKAEDLLDERGDQLPATEASMPEIDEQVAALEKSVGERDAKIQTLETERDALKERIASLETARTEQQKRADEATSELVRRDLESLVNVKITKAEVEGLAKLAVLSRALYDEQIESVKGRPDMVLGERSSTIGTDPAPQKTAISTTKAERPDEKFMAIARARGLGR